MVPAVRKLRLLIIDDELARSFSGYKVPSSIEVWTLSENLPGIDKWRTALQFWSNFNNDEVPDLVLADVRFIEDRTSPLSALFPQNENYLPTGLSHLKAFAALSRALGKPLGVCTRTIDPDIWKDQIESDKPENKAMGYLAAHEIGEIAAILGDGNEILGNTTDRQQHIQNCHAWLRKNSATPFEEGLQRAVKDYRRRLFRLLTAPDVSSIFVRPSHYAELMSWCQQMRENPEPLDPQHDFGLEITYHNGKRDVISIASLFADFEGIVNKRLEPSAFEDDVRSLSEPWELDDDARPRIGVYLSRLGSMTAAYKDAAEAVKEYATSYPLPENYRPRTLAAIKSGDGYTALTAGLTVLFQFVHLEQKRVEQWENSFDHDSWNPKKLQFVSGTVNTRDTLKLALQKLIDVVRDYTEQLLDNSGEDVEGEDEFTRADLFDEFPDDWVVKVNVDRGEQDREWVKWHFERLVDAGVLGHKIKRGEDYYTLSSNWRGKAPQLNPPPTPNRLPRVVSNVRQGKGVQRDPNRVQLLRLSLGYKSNDFNSVERVLGEAFGGAGVKKYTEQGAEKAAAKAKIGREMLNELEELNMPFFLLEICREYATEFLKWPRDRWPKWLQNSAAQYTESTE